MDLSIIPKVTCRFKIRQDLDGFIGFFEGKGVLTFNRLGAYIVSKMLGFMSIQDIAREVKREFPDVSEPKEEVIALVRQLQETGFVDFTNKQATINH